MYDRVYVGVGQELIKTQYTTAVCKDVASKSNSMHCHLHQLRLGCMRLDVGSLQQEYLAHKATIGKKYSWPGQQCVLSEPDIRGVTEVHVCICELLTARIAQCKAVVCKDIACKSSSVFCQNYMDQMSTGLHAETGYFKQGNVLIMSSRSLPGSI